MQVRDYPKTFNMDDLYHFSSIMIGSDHKLKWFLILDCDFIYMVELQDIYDCWSENRLRLKLLTQMKVEKSIAKLRKTIILDLSATESST